jgi:hypothetical protein
LCEGSVTQKLAQTVEKKKRALQILKQVRKIQGQSMMLKLIGLVWFSKL